MLYTLSESRHPVPWQVLRASHLPYTLNKTLHPVPLQVLRASHLPVKDWQIMGGRADPYAVSAAA